MTPRQLKFCRYYAATGNGAEAARRAGYASASAHVAASRLVARAEIQEQVRMFSKKYARQEGFDTDSIIGNLLDIAEQPSIAEYLTQTEDGELVWKDISDLTPRQLTAIKTTNPIKNVLESWSSVELHDRATALSTLVNLTQPLLTKQQQNTIVTALTRTGSKRGFTQEEIELLECVLTGERIAA